MTQIDSEDEQFIEEVELIGKPHLAELREAQAEIKQLRAALRRITRDAGRARKANWITRLDAMEHIARLAHHADEALNRPTTVQTETKP